LPLTAGTGVGTTPVFRCWNYTGVGTTPGIYTD
jgi:hypothetical protein